ncbi:hypothetical protein X474_22705 [Dethiosulfatarculus sandiegensis]|uniref:Uncharacterized protein n=1 Tax=Dethiosulfatarculus sandiegensis TaxID=1429043 RepID=A0A0D2JQI6_9BACT|nr:hypothetical protein X474_22705 [Dethiosulfatarculus sandiegensis]
MPPNSSRQLEQQFQKQLKTFFLKRPLTAGPGKITQRGFGMTHNTVFIRSTQYDFFNW